MNTQTKHMLRVLLLLLTFGICRPATAQDAVLARIGKRAHDSVPSLGALLVVQHDQPLYTGYWNGADSATVFNVKSVTKSVTALLAGIARGQQLLPELNTPVLALLPGMASPRSVPGTWFARENLYHDSLRARLTLRHLLTMQAGFDWDDFGSEGAGLLTATDPARYTLDRPFAAAPGTSFNYNTGASILFGAALDAAVGDLREFADSNFFAPLAIARPRWDRDALGRVIGGSELFLKAPDLVKIGRLVLGYPTSLKLGSWIHEMTRGEARLDRWPVLPGANGYGYYWWRRLSNGHQVYVASGYGGQLICVVPDIDLIVVTTCFLNERNRGRSELLRLHRLIDGIIRHCATLPDADAVGTCYPDLHRLALLPHINGDSDPRRNTVMSAQHLAGGISLTVDDPGVRIVSFTLSYDCDNCDIWQKHIAGSRVTPANAPILLHLRKGEGLYVDCIQVTKKGKRYTIPGRSVLLE